MCTQAMKLNDRAVFEKTSDHPKSTRRNMRDDLSRDIFKRRRRPYVSETFAGE